MQSKQQVYVSTGETSVGDQKIHFSASKYHNNIVLIVNHSGNIGSILEGELESENGDDPIYEISTKFGATDQSFYQILFRRMLDLIYVEQKVKGDVRTTLIISLPLKSKNFSEKEYYDPVYEGIKNEIKAVA